MKKPIFWQDVSSHSRTAIDRTPKTWAAKVGREELIVSRHVHYPGLWVVSYGTWFSNYALPDEVETSDQAKDAAILFLKRKVASIQSALE